MLSSAVLAWSVYRLSFEAIAGIGLVAGTIGFVGLVVAAFFWFGKTRMALRAMSDEAALAKRWA